ncbi:MAG: DUF3467 domain-containing protein [Pseudomonadota bacterium]
MTDGSQTPPAETAESARAAVVWDDAAMQTQFANVVNIQSTQEQVDLFFGTNRAWSGGGRPASPSGGAAAGVEVELSHRIILGPHAAKRLMLALDQVMGEYEKRYGELVVAGPPA